MAADSKTPAVAPAAGSKFSALYEQLKAKRDGCLALEKIFTASSKELGDEDYRFARTLNSRALKANKEMKEIIDNGAARATGAAEAMPMK